MVNLLRKTEVNDKQSNYLRTIKEASNNLRVIIDEILDFSKLEAGHVEMEAIEFSPADVVEQTLQMLTVQSQEKGLEFESIIEDSMPGLVVGDPVRLNQVLINLTGNAIKFTESGKVSIQARSLANDGSTAIIEFRVQDSGIGIPPEKQSTIWDKFTQAASDTKRRFGGTGLGLAISKQLVELQGGSIGLESEPGKGSTFHFQIPYPVVSQEASKESSEEVKTGTQLRNLNVLLVEDNEFNVMVAVDTLEMEVEGISIDHAENGKIALDRLRDKDYDMILMDIQMPVMDGYEASRHIRQDFAAPKSGIPILAMTASVTPTEVQAVFEAGMNEVVAKPFEAEELLSKMELVLGAAAQE
jgi:CheY-like chemotaxis protein